MPLLVGLVVVRRWSSAGAAVLAAAADAAPTAAARRRRRDRRPGRHQRRPAPNDPSIAGPQFVGVPLDYNRVVFVIDRGQAGCRSFDPLKAALFNAITSLGPQREFQVLFWTAAGVDGPRRVRLPQGRHRPRERRPGGSLKKHLEDVTTVGATDAGAGDRGRR